MSKWHVETLAVTKQPVILDEAGVLIAGGMTIENAPLIEQAPDMYSELELALSTLDSVEGRHLPRGKSEHHKRVWADCELTRQRIKEVLAKVANK